MLNIEYRVRPVTRYIVTRYHSDMEVVKTDDLTAVYSRGPAGIDTCGEFANEDMAGRVAKALADAEPEGTVSVDGYPLDRCLSEIVPAPAEATD